MMKDIAPMVSVPPLAVSRASEMYVIFTFILRYSLNNSRLYKLALLYIDILRKQSKILKQ